MTVSLNIIGVVVGVLTLNMSFTSAFLQSTHSVVYLPAARNLLVYARSYFRMSPTAEIST